MSGETIWHLTMSLDGFRADQDGSLAWIGGQLRSRTTRERIVASIGAVLAGH